MDDLLSLPAIKYMQGCNHSRNEISRLSRPNITPVRQYKTYPDSRRITLPAVSPRKHFKEPDLAQILKQRRSHRRFSSEKISIEMLATLLWGAQGITAQAGNFLLRTSPSAGALYPIETYVAIREVEGLDQGLYHFNPQQFELEQIRENDVSQDLAMAALGQQFIHQANVTFVWSAIYRRNFIKYGNRGLRYVLLDAGHICQNLLLTAEAMELGGCAVAAFFDDEVNEILQIDGEGESAVYMAATGAKE